MRVNIPRNFPKRAIDALNSDNGIQLRSEIRVRDAVRPNVTDRSPDRGVQVFDCRKSGCRVLALNSFIFSANSISERGGRIVFVGGKGEDDGEIPSINLCIDVGAFVINPNPFRLKLNVRFHLHAVKFEWSGEWAPQRWRSEALSHVGCW